jgi:FkbM family methyltransferase
MKIVNYLGHTFVPSFFSAGGIAIDCGSNHGGFARFLSEESQLVVHSFEADPRLFARLPKLPRVNFCEFAIAGESGTIELGLGDEHCSSVVYRENAKQNTVTVPAISLDEYCEKHAISVIDIIKMDIEGAELDVLESISEKILQNTKQITVEFHDFLNAADLPRIEQIVARMKSAGFYFLKVSKHTWGDCLFLNQRLLKVNASTKFSLALRGKYLPGLGRVLNRLLKRKQT